MVKVEVDKKSMAAFEHNMRQLVAITKETVEDILKQQGRLFAKAAAKYTERFGDDKATGKRHKTDVKETIKSVYRPFPAKYCREKVKAYRSAKALKEWNRAVRSKDAVQINDMAQRLNMFSFFNSKGIKIIEWDKGAAHTRRLKGKGSKALHLVLGPAKNHINPYIRKKQEQVGAAKYGWVKAAKMLGHKGTGTGFPQWFSKGHRTRGFGRVRGTGSKAELTVAHYGKYGFTKTSMSGLFRHRTNMMAGQIESMIKAGNREAAKARRMSFSRTKRIIRTAR